VYTFDEYSFSFRFVQNQTNLLELLELPQLMDTCVRQQLYDEALKLDSFARSLLARYTNAPILEQIVHEMDNSNQTLVMQLLLSLQGPLQLPACLRIVGFIKRLDMFSESVREFSV
jgi:hypothetical protein